MASIEGPAVIKTTQQELKLAEDKVKKLRKEGATKEQVGIYRIISSTNQIYPILSCDKKWLHCCCP